MFKQTLPIALTAAALLGTVACERKTDDDMRRDEQIEVPDRNEADDPELRRTERVDDTRMSADMQRRLDEAEARYNKLERQLASARERTEAKGAEARTDLERELTDARDKAKRDLEAARKASAAQARDILEDLEEALDNLDKKLQGYDQT